MSDDNPRCQKCEHRASWCICRPRDGAVARDDSKAVALSAVLTAALDWWAFRTLAESSDEREASERALADALMNYMIPSVITTERQ